VLFLHSLAESTCLVKPFKPFTCASLTVSSSFLLQGRGTVPDPPPQIVLHLLLISFDPTKSRLPLCVFPLICPTFFFSFFFLCCYDQKAVAFDLYYQYLFFHTSGIALSRNFCGGLSFYFPRVTFSWVANVLPAFSDPFSFFFLNLTCSMV